MSSPSSKRRRLGIPESAGFPADSALRDIVRDSLAKARGRGGDGVCVRGGGGHARAGRSRLPRC